MNLLKFFLLQHVTTTDANRKSACLQNSSLPRGLCPPTTWLIRAKSAPQLGRLLATHPQQTHLLPSNVKKGDLSLVLLPFYVIDIVVNLIS